VSGPNTGAPNPALCPPVYHQGPEPFDLTPHRDTVRKLVLSTVGVRIEALGADVEDVMQDVFVRLVRASRSARSGYDPTRGYSFTTWLCMVGTSAAKNHLRDLARLQGREVVSEAPETEAPEVDVRAVMADVLGVLDLPEEREMALHLAAGCTLAEVRERMGMEEGEASELRTRVRALLMGLREER